MLHQRFVTVAGVTYEGRQKYVKALTADSPVSVVAEPQNQHDKQAHAVYAGEPLTKIGYIPRRDLAEIYPLLASATAIRARIWDFLEQAPDLNPDSRGVRIHLEIDVPESSESTIAAANQIFGGMQGENTPERDGD